MIVVEQKEAQQSPVGIIEIDDRHLICMPRGVYIQRILVGLTSQIDSRTPCMQASLAACMKMLDQNKVKQNPNLDPEIFPGLVT